jgi:hypothetical protein
VTVEQLEQSVLKLSPDERRRFALWFYEHESEILGADDEIHPEVQAEILRRRDEAMAQPERLEAWETAFPRMRHRFNELCRQNPYTR